VIQWHRVHPEDLEILDYPEVRDFQEDQQILRSPKRQVNLEIRVVLEHLLLLGHQEAPLHLKHCSITSYTMRGYRN